MSAGTVIGFDIGDEACVVGQAKRGGIDVLLNENSNRLNPCLVSFQGNRRFVGEAALSLARGNYKNTVVSVKRLIGKSWADPALQRELELLPYTAAEAPDGGVGINVQYGGETVMMKPEQILSMVLGQLSTVAVKANAGALVADVVVSIPQYFTYAQRSAVRDAIKIADLNCLRLLHEHTAVALSYGIYKFHGAASADAITKSHSAKTIVLFVDMGRSKMTASVVAYSTGCLHVLGSAHDESLGGGAFDCALAKYLSAEFKEKTGEEVSLKKDPRAWIKLLLAAEKAKKSLSPQGIKMVPLNVECLANDKDLQTKVHLEKFEELLAPLLERVAGPVHRALADAKVDASKLTSVEVVGGASRSPCVRRAILEALKEKGGKEDMVLSHTLNADEAIAKGCALQCAILSTKFSVKPFLIFDSVPEALVLQWDPPCALVSLTPSAVNKSGDKPGYCVAFNAGDVSPKTRVLKLALDDSSGQDLSSLVLTANVEGAKDEDTPLYKAALKIPAPKDSKAKRWLEVYVEHTLDGMVTVSKTVLASESEKEETVEEEVSDGFETEEEEEEEKEKVEDKKEEETVEEKEGEGAKDEKGEEKAEAEEAGKKDKTDEDKEGKEEEGKKEDEKGEDAKKEDEEGEEDKKEDEEGEDAKKEAKKEEAKKEDKKVRKKKYKKVQSTKLKKVESSKDINVALLSSCACAGVGADKLKDLCKEEVNMATQDEEIRQTEEMRNNVETFVYETRSQLSEGGSWNKYGSKDEVSSMLELLQKSEDWLYDDGANGGGGDGVKKGVYAAKLKEMREHKVMKKILERQRAEGEREVGVRAIRDACAQMREREGEAGKPGGLKPAQVVEVRKWRTEVEGWLETKLAEQAKIDPTSGAKPALTAAELRLKLAELNAKYQPLCASAEVVRVPSATRWSYAGLVVVALFGVLMAASSAHTLLTHMNGYPLAENPLNPQGEMVQRCKMYAGPNKFMYKKIKMQLPSSDNTSSPPLHTVSRLAHKYIVRRVYVDKAEQDHELQTRMHKQRDSKNPIRPVLFVPGNLGSFEQAKWFAKQAAAEAAAVAEGKPSKFAADDVAGEEVSLPKESGGELMFYTIDFRDEPSAWSAGLVYDQAEYLNDALKMVTQLHQRALPSADFAPKEGQTSAEEPEGKEGKGAHFLPAIVVAHSTGGVVAQLAMTLPNHDPGSLRTLLTLSSPHAVPRLQFDSEMVEVYDRVHRFWSSAQRPLSALPPAPLNSSNATAAEVASQGRFKEMRRFHEHQRDTLADTVVVAIAGGHHDMYIPASLTKLPYYVPAHWRRHQTACGDTVLASSLRRLGFSVDHQALIWCRQLVRSVTVALMADTRAVVSGDTGAACKEGEGEGKDGRCAEGEGSNGSARLKLMLDTLQVDTAGKTNRPSFERQLKSDNKQLRAATGTDWSGDDDEASAIAAYLPLFIIEPLLPPVPAQVLQKFGPLMLVPIWTLLTLLVFTVPQFEWLQGERGAKAPPPNPLYCLRPHCLLRPALLAVSGIGTFLMNLLFSATEGVGLTKYIPSITGGFITEQWLRAYRRTHGVHGDPVAGGALVLMLVLQTIKESGANEVRAPDHLLSSMQLRPSTHPLPCCNRCAYLDAAANGFHEGLVGRHAH
jgi:molecular chaperone DnaK (HSP70)